jgi:hypothetical protein
VTGCSLFLVAEAEVCLAKLGTSFESTRRRRVVETDGLVDTRSFGFCCETEGEMLRLGLYLLGTLNESLS